MSGGRNRMTVSFTRSRCACPWFLMPVNWFKLGQFLGKLPRKAASTERSFPRGETWSS